MCKEFKRGSRLYPKPVIYLGELKTLEELVNIRADLKSKNKKVVFTSGVFDLLHIGHKLLLEKAGRLGNVLIVGINSDASVKRLKKEKPGETKPRPHNNQKKRADELCQLPTVDYVVIFKEDTPEKTLEILKPDIHVKGGDWKAENLPETKIVESYGGKVVIINSGSDVSTSSTIMGILKKSKE